MDKNGSKRVFFALNPPSESREAIARYINTLKKDSKNVRWARPEGIHLTLQFIGDLPESKIRRLDGEILKAGFSGREEMRFRTSGVGTFPDGGPPRIIHLKVEQVKGPSARQLRERLLSVLNETLKFEPDKRIWRPHLTIGRAKGRPVLDKARLDDCQKIEFTCDTFELMSSKLDNNGAKYKIIKTYGF